MEILSSGEVRTNFPSLRCKMGDWIYYVTFMRFIDVAKWIKRTDQIHQNKNLRDMIQRELTGRVTPIVNYLIEQNERFFNSIVVGVYDGDPQWYPIEINKEIGDVPELDEISRQALGVLDLQGTENLFAIDGQHRVEAIKQTIELEPARENDEISVIFVAHSTSKEGMTRTRRLFSTLNRYAKPVSKGEIVALDEDDAFAITTRRLVEDFSLFRSDSTTEGFVRFGKTSPLPGGDQISLTSILTLYDITSTIHIPFNDKNQRKAKQKLKILRPTDAVLNQILDEQVTYWNLLQTHIPAYKELFQSHPDQYIAGKYRTTEGGHLMFRPMGQKAFASAVRVLLDRRWMMDEAVEALSFIPMEINEAPWVYTLWNPSLRRINSKVNSMLLESILLHSVKEIPRKPSYDLLEQYRRVLDDPNADLNFLASFP
jgi:DNA sulfur modification protein DndB